jgi:transcription elongation factor GreA
MIANLIPMTPNRHREMLEELEALRMQATPPAEGTRGNERMQALEEKLSRAEVIEPGRRDRVFFGAVVKVRDRSRNRIEEYALVGPEELDPESGRISSASPIGRALMGRRVGETVAIRVPKGELHLEILAFH